MPNDEVIITNPPKRPLRQAPEKTQPAKKDKPKK